MDLFDEIGPVTKGSAAPPAGDIFDQVGPAKSEMTSMKVVHEPAAPTNTREAIKSVEALMARGLSTAGSELGRVGADYASRTGRRITEAAGALNNIPAAIGSLVTGKRDTTLRDFETGQPFQAKGISYPRTSSLIELLVGAAGPLNALSAPFIEGPSETAAAPFVSEEAARTIGDLAGIVGAAGIGGLAASGRLTRPGMTVNELIGVGSPKPQGAVLNPGDVPARMPVRAEPAFVDDVLPPTAPVRPEPVVDIPAAPRRRNLAEIKAAEAPKDIFDEIAPVKTAEVAPELTKAPELRPEPSPVVEPKPGARAAFDNFMEQTAIKHAQESKGQEILFDLEDSGKTPNMVVKEFWDETYDRLPPEVQSRFHSYLKKETGLAPGQVVASGPKGKVVAKTWRDVYPEDVPPKEVEYLEGTERGLISLMEEANRRRPKTAPAAAKSVEAPRQIAAGSEIVPEITRAEAEAAGFEWADEMPRMRSDSEIAGNPWKKTRDEYMEAVREGHSKGTENKAEYGGLTKKQHVQMVVKAAETNHEYFVKQALKEGKPVPESVLADYPDLKPKPQTLSQAAIPDDPRTVAQSEPKTFAAPKPKRQVLEDPEVAVSTFINRHGGIRVPKELKEEFGGWNRLHKADAMGVDEMAEEAFNAGLIPEPTTNALIDGLKSGRKSARTMKDTTKSEMEFHAARKIDELTDTPAKLEFKGKEYSGAVQEGKNIRLKDHPDKLLTKANDILKVEEKIPFDIPPETPAPRFEPTPAGMQARIPGTEARKVPEGILKGKRKQAETMTDLERASVPDDQPSLIEGKPRGASDILKSEEGSIRLGPLRIKDGKPVEAPTQAEAQKAISSLRLNAGNYVEESSKTLKKTMGEAGGTLADKAKAMRNDAELDAGRVNQPLGKIVNALKKEESTNLVDVIEGKAGPVSPKVKEAAGYIKAELAKIAERAEEVGLKIKNPITGEQVPWQPRKNFFPHMFDKELSTYAKTPDGMAKIKASIKKRNPNASDKEVQRIFENIIKGSRTRYGHLEMARVIDRDDYIRDPHVLLKYITDSYRRIHIAEKFGPDLAKGETLLTKIGLSKGDDAESFARTYFQRVTDTEPEGNRALKKFSQAARNFNAMSKLGQAVLSNVSQPVFTAVHGGAVKTARGVAASMTKEGRKFGEMILNDSVRDFLKESNLKDTGKLSKAADAVLKYTGFTAVEKNNRIISANTGRYMARDMFDKLKKNTGNARLREGLEKLRVNVDQALENGKLSELDELRAGQTIVNKTQFKVDVTELPLEWSSDVGRMLTQFKSFQFKAGQFVKDEILKEMTKGNVAPFLRAAALFPIAGFGVMTLKDAVRLGEQRERKENIADYLSAVGTFGAFTDAFASSGRQPVKGLQQLAGPTLGEAGVAWEAAAGLAGFFPGGAEGEWRPAAKLIAKNIPVAGPSLRQLFNKPKDTGPRQKTKRKQRKERK